MLLGMFEWDMWDAYWWGGVSSVSSLVKMYEHNCAIANGLFIFLFVLFCPFLQMADCGGMPQVDQVRTSAQSRLFFFVAVLFMLWSDEGQVGRWMV